MVQVHFITADGQSATAEAEAGQSLMEAALNANLPGIEGQCGGFLNCATCHVYVAEAWLDRLPPPDEEEEELLEGTAEPRRPNSRLSCQIRITDALEGLTAGLPASQS